MHKPFFSIFCVLLPFVLFAQPNDITLTGILAMNTGESFPYTIVFTESGGIIKGYSFTYKKPEETKAAITGLLDRAHRSLSFKETGIVYSNGYHTKAYMCLIDARLEYVQGGRGNVLSGPLTSKEADKTLCTGGVITFGNDAEIQNLFGYHEKFDTVISMKKRVPEVPGRTNEAKPVVPTAPMTTEQVTTGIVKTYDWHSDTVVIAIWDGGHVDGDRVTLQYNGKNYLTNYSLVKEKKQVRVPVSQHGIDTITIIADNEGSEPPNTASLMLTDGSIHYSILAYNKQGDRAVIKIKRSPPANSGGQTGR